MLPSPLGAWDQSYETNRKKKKLAFSASFFSQIKKDGLISNRGIYWTNTQAVQACPHCPIVAEPASLIRLGLCWLLGWRAGLRDTGRLPGNFLFSETGHHDCSTARLSERNSSASVIPQQPWHRYSTKRDEGKMAYLINQRETCCKWP